MSDTAEGLRSAGEARPAARLGAELRAARQRLGWELPDLAGSLRIRQSYLEAIEAGRMAELPGTTYALGFVRTYASALGLPGEEVSGRFRAEAEEVQNRPTLSFPAPVPQRGVPAGALMLLGLVILAGAYGGWYYLSEHQRTPVETVPPIPDRMLPLIQAPAGGSPAKAKLPPSPQVASVLPSASPPSPSGAPSLQAGIAPAPAIPSQAAGPALSTSTLPPGAGAATAPHEAPSSVSGPQIAPAAQPSPKSAAPEPAAPASSAATALAAPPGLRVLIKTSADAWVTVKQKAGAPLLNKLMRAGDSFAVPPDKTGLTLTTGNAGGTQVEVDGAAVAGIGGSGMVRRDLPLDPDSLKTGHIAPIIRGRPKPAPTPAAADAG